TANGKVDKRALPPPREDDVRGAEYLPPRTELEERLCDIWAHELEVDRVGIDDNFFELGGESLIAMRIVGEIRGRLGLDASLATVLEQPTIAALARALTNHQRSVSLPNIVVQ